ncbi:MAG TPA: ATP-binding protein [Arenimonas sp.]|jgi:SpoVK/Ycf46/Vps4 family AAA+-type ATPase|nr:ATP-binding protein [Arenimonas sp.]
MERRAQEELLLLLRDAMKIGGAAIEMRIRKFASVIRSTDEALALAVTPLVSGARSLRRSIFEELPVDAESKLPLVREEPAEVQRGRPILPAHLHGELDRIVHERLAADRLHMVGLAPVRSVLMDGPPGVGKTMTAGWLATQLKLPLVTLDLASVMSSYLGRTGANLRSVLSHAQTQPCVLLLDEFDAIAKRRHDDGDVGELKRLVTVILQAIDDWTSTSLLVAATNHGELLDPAVWRRFDVNLRFELPSAEERLALLTQCGVDPALATAIATVAQGQTLSAISRAVDRARKQEFLAVRSFAESLVDWAVSTTSDAKDATKAAVMLRRELNIVLLHEQGMSAREIAETVGASHTTALRALKKMKGDSFVQA